MTPDSSRPRRILLTLDAIGDASAMIDLAVELAAALNAQLHSQFVEDIDLLRIAELPCTSEIMLSSASERPMDANSILRALQNLSAQSREYLNRIADQASVQWSFNIVRGRRIESGLDESEEYDLTIIGPSGTRHAVRRINPRRKRILFIDGNPSEMRQAFELIEKLSLVSSIELTVLEQDPKMDKRVLGKIQDGLDIHVNPSKAYQVDMLSRSGSERPDYVIATRHQSLLMLREIVRESNCPVILVS
jgi:nucleotide-binding universal stress UspA family protein